MKSIYWLASYPKSGNTWLRLLLANYRQPDGRPVGINDLGGSIAASRELFEEAVGIDSSELSAAEIMRCRPQVYRALAARTTEPLFIKVHDAHAFTPTGEALFPPEVTSGVVYVARNPLDVVTSLAHHRGATADEAIRFMCDERATVAVQPGRLDPQLPQVLGSWSGHVRSWLDGPLLRLHVLRYEDLLADPASTFHAIVRFAGLPIDEARIAAAAEATRFDRLQSQELEQGFAERLAGSTRPFFGHGVSGGWRDELTAAQVGVLIDAHGETMRRFGYLSDRGEPV